MGVASKHLAEELRATVWRRSGCFPHALRGPRRRRLWEVRAATLRSSSAHVRRRAHSPDMDRGGSAPSPWGNPFPFPSWVRIFALRNAGIWTVYKGPLGVSVPVPVWTRLRPVFLPSPPLRTFFVQKKSRSVDRRDFLGSGNGS